FEPPATRRLASVVEQLRFYTHGALAHVEVRRWADASSWEVRSGVGRCRGEVEFVDADRGGARVALGLAIDVDAVAIDVRVPDHLLSGRALDERHLRGLRGERFQAVMRDARILEERVGDLGVSQITEAMVLAFSRLALVRRSDLRSAYEDARDQDRVPEFVRE